MLCFFFASLIGCATDSRSGSTVGSRSYAPNGSTPVKTIVLTSWRSSPNGGKPLPWMKLEAAEKAADAVSAPTADAGKEKAADAVSGASEGAPDTEGCLRCHGPFDKLAERTADYVTVWDEHVNPHMYVPHDSQTVVDCSSCHDPHPIPYAPAEGGRKPSVEYCYSCHHTEELVSCSQCHNE